MELGCLGLGVGAGLGLAHLDVVLPLVRGRVRVRVRAKARARVRARVRARARARARVPVAYPLLGEECEAEGVDAHLDVVLPLVRVRVRGRVRVGGRVRVRVSPLDSVVALHMPHAVHAWCTRVHAHACSVYGARAVSVSVLGATCVPCTIFALYSHYSSTIVAL